MQVAGQRIEDRAAVPGASADQRHLAGEVNALLNDTLAVVILRQLRGFIFPQTPLAAAIVAADAALNDSQLPEAGEYRRPFAFIRQKLPRRGGERQLIEQLLLRQAVGDYRENVAVNEGGMTRQLAGQRRFRPAFNLCGNHALLYRHRFRVGFQTDRPDRNTQRLAGLAQHPA